MHATALPAMGKPVVPIAAHPYLYHEIVTMKGRLLIRNVCMVFDRYHETQKNGGPCHDMSRHSQTL